MKKIYLLAATLGLAGAVSAQNATSLHNVANFNGEERSLVNADRAAGDILFQDDFANQTNWTVDNQGQGDWLYTTTTPTDMDQYWGQMASTTAANGFHVFNGIQWLLAGNVDPQDSRLEMNSDINCGTVGNVTLQFEQRYRAFNTDETWVDVSTDGGTTWPHNFQVNADEPGNGPTVQNTVLLNITSAAANQGTVRIRFRWVEASDDNSFGSGYGWGIDDVKIIESWNHDHEIGIAYGVMGPQNLDYHFIPTSQVSAITYTGEVCNNGAAAQTATKLNAVVSNAESASLVSNTFGLAPAACDSVGTNSTFTPSAGEGTYDVAVFFDSENTEEVTNNDTVYLPFDVTANVYSRDNGLSSGSISNVTSQPGQPLKIGNIMDVMADMTVGYLQVGIANNNGLSVGQTVTAEIQRFNAGSGAYEFGAQTTEHTVANGEESSIITLTLDGGDVTLNAGDDILVLVGHNGGVDLNSDGNPDEVAFLMAQNTFEGSVIGYTADGNPFTLTSPGAVMVRLLEQSQGIGENSLVATTSVYPNPANEQATINFSLTSSAKVTVELVDYAGKVISSTDLGTVSAGSNQHVVNTAELAEGVYFYNLNVAGDIITKKLVVSKK